MLVIISGFRNNPTSPGINYEKLTACKDKKICSVRIDNTYRGIVVRQPETGVYLLLWVDHHDEAYEWAKNKKCEVNQQTGAIQVYDVITPSDNNPVVEEFMLFAAVSDKDMIELGVPYDMLPFVRSITDVQDFHSKQNSFPSDAFENLSSSAEPRYKHIIVDEGQDFSANALMLLRTIAGEEHENDIFIVGDSHQRIYKNKAILSKCGINIRGRSSILRINYRTTEEIRKSAFALLNGISFDDLDDNDDNYDQCRSLTHGLAPQIQGFNNANDEFSFVLHEIRHLIENGVSAKNICVVARTNKLIDDYTAQFTSNGMRCYKIKRSKSDDRSLDGIRVATMHRVKWLEFQYLFIVAANNRIIPLASSIDHTDTVILCAVFI